MILQPSGCLVVYLSSKTSNVWVFSFRRFFFLINIIQKKCTGGVLRCSLVQDISLSSVKSPFLQRKTIEKKMNDVYGVTVPERLNFCRLYTKRENLCICCKSEIFLLLILSWCWSDWDKSKTKTKTETILLSVNRSP